ncbi:hypothetical protein DFS33DRAFT_1312176 [Desarmillaria ectypa]|nr:hypothetical protein DFS33DRAFT_1312176 [Desarmillaria ectypa]
MPQCSQCAENFLTTKDWATHCKQVRDHNFCYQCKILFTNRASLHLHLQKSAHRNYCTICDRLFLTKQAYSQHNNSLVHKVPDLKCALCTHMFKAPSEIAAYLESGGCNPNINRRHVTAAVHAMKVSPAISISNRIRGPTTVQHVHLAATEIAFNGKAYECYLCHDTFRTLRSLNLHLASPIHDANEFKCP